jgi:hypothetical protein
MKLMGINFIGWFFTIVVSIILIIWVQVVWDEVSLVLTGIRTKAVVVTLLDGGDLTNIEFEFKTAKGEKITCTSKNGSALAPTVKAGDVVRVVYKESNPYSARIMSWGDSGLWVILGILWFLFVFSYIWLGLIKMTGDESVGDPLHLLPKCSWLFPYVTMRITVYVFLAFGLFGFGLTDYVFAANAHELRTSGIRVTGIVTGFEDKNATTNGITTSSKDFAIIRYVGDTSGGWYTIRKSIIKPFSNINIGDTRDIIYPVGKPDKGVENTWWVLWFPTFFFSAVVILFISLMVVLHNHPDLLPAATEKELKDSHEKWEKGN